LLSRYDAIMPNLSLEERISLHGEAYVAAFETQTARRIVSLLDLMELRSDSDVADFGCGNAMLLNHIHEKIRSYVGVDFSEPFIRSAKRNRDHIGAANADFRCMSIQSFCAEHLECFDVCFALDISEHVDDYEWQAIVKGMFRCLKPGGSAYLHTPNREFVIEKMKAVNFILKQFPQHVAVRDGEDNARFFFEAGFLPVSVTYLPHYNVLRLFHPLSRLPIVGPLFQARIFLHAVKPAGK